MLKSIDLGYCANARQGENRKNKIDGSEKKDIHEVNEDYLKKSYENATAISKKYNWCEIECVENNKIKSIEKINDEIFFKIKEIIGGKNS